MPDVKKVREALERFSSRFPEMQNSSLTETEKDALSAELNAILKETTNTVTSFVNNHFSVPFSQKAGRGSGNWSAVPYIALFSPGAFVYNGIEIPVRVNYHFDFSEKKIYLALLPFAQQLPELWGENWRSEYGKPKGLMRDEIRDLSNHGFKFDDLDPKHLKPTDAGNKMRRVFIAYKTYDMGALPIDEVIEKDLIEASRAEVELNSHANIKPNIGSSLPVTPTAHEDPTILLMLSKKQIILYGPPGTGKTYGTKGAAVEVIDLSTASMSQKAIDARYSELKAEGRIEFITFHPSYSYEEFIEGITVEVSPDGKPSEHLQYKLKQGIFKNMVARALAIALGDPIVDSAGGLCDLNLKKLLNAYRRRVYLFSVGLEDKPENGLQTPAPEGVVRKRHGEWWEGKPALVLIIDEINRGDISKIFGELITLLEADKRLGMENELTVRLPYSQEEFGVPPNLLILGTMNTADKSIALIDVALRRRFGFVERAPDFPLLKRDHLDRNAAKLKAADVNLELESSRVLIMETINKAICLDRSIGRDKQIGHSFFFKVFTQEDLMMVWQNEILPLLEEYYYSQYTKINKLLFGIETSNWITETGGIRRFKDYEDFKAFLKAAEGKSK